MGESQNSADLIHTTSDTLSYLSLSTQPNIKYKSTPDPLSVYVPLDSLTEETIDSIVSTVQQSNKKDWNHSRRTLLAFLLAIKNKVSDIEKQDSKNTFDKQIVQHARKVGEWLVEKDHSGNINKLDWDELRKTYEQMASENDDGMARHYSVTNVEPYYELTIEGLHADINQSREYMARFRSHGWEPNELKIYWNVQQLENLCPKHETQAEQVEVRDEEKTDVNSETKHTLKDTTKVETKLEKNEEVKNEATVDVKNESNNEVRSEVKGESNEEAKNEATVEAKTESKNEVRDQVKDELNEETNGEPTVETKTESNNEARSEVNDEAKAENFPPHDPSDADVIRALRQYPVSKRNNAGKITYVNKGIEKAVFDVPEDAQIIVLNFANERSPGGGYLRHAWAQEEIILYNSDGYRALLDLKYGRMGGGYAIPEFGLAYVRDICFFDKKTDKNRKADMLVSACYCLTGSPQLYDNPKTDEEWETKNLAKFNAFMAAAVANTKGDGSNTYLLLGPIGTGAFGNDVTKIGNVFRKVLTSKLMGTNGPIAKAFENIWGKSAGLDPQHRLTTISTHFGTGKCTRIPDSILDLNEVAYHDEPSKIYLGSPSIIRLSSGRLVASHDFFGPGYAFQPRNVSIYVSDNNGETWSFISYIKHSYWTTLAVYNDIIYAIGTDSDSNANIIIHRSSDSGLSWNYNGSDDGVVLFHGSFATGPTPIVIANQVMYRAIEAWPTPRWPTDFQAAIISCNLSISSKSTEDDPIMSPNNWRLTPPLIFNKEWIPKSFPNLNAPGYLEGNVVIVPKPSSK
ncbi:unnamed protein product [Rotaria sordida]|uniref:Microbial-type PARG catalytic domain-containing protein n=1 Tax=Rotaria sordida TaxID=392033 RepID=A0A818Z8F1_9BILA|nr:unnamed protein product [Rotaria sordida]